MRKGSSESTATVIPTEYGPLVLVRAVAFAGEEAASDRPRHRGKGVDKEAQTAERPA